MCVCVWGEGSNVEQTRATSAVVIIPPGGRKSSVDNSPVSVSLAESPQPPFSSFLMCGYRETCVGFCLDRRRLVTLSVLKL